MRKGKLNWVKNMTQWWLLLFRGCQLAAGTPCQMRQVPPVKWSSPFLGRMYGREVEMDQSMGTVSSLGAEAKNGMKWELSSPGGKFKKQMGVTSMYLLICRVIFPCLNTQSIIFWWWSFQKTSRHLISVMFNPCSNCPWYGLLAWFLIRNLRFRD